MGGLKIPRLKDANGDIANIDINGHFDANGDFSVTASDKDGFQPIELPNVLKLHINSLEVRKEEDDFYLGTACDIEFTNSVIQSLIGDQRIKISRLRIWSDGSFEIVGGTIPVPASFGLKLGPVEVDITGINYGTYQQEHRGKMRKYNYFGFDGAISLNPLGVDARGEGIKYYFTIDDNTDVPSHDPDYRPHHSYVRIQAIEVDITIPGNASAATATAIIKGFLSIAEEEYAGGISLKIPKAKISGSAKMRLQPKHPAFIVDADIELPKPIPLGSTGLGVFAFRGILGYRFVAAKEAVGLVSGEDSWYDYYKYPPRGINIEKFSAPNDTTHYENPFSLGAGASFATYGSDSILSLRVFVLLSIPSLFMIEGKASVLSKRYGLDDTGEPPFFAFLAVGDQSIEAGLGADFSLSQNNGWIVDLHAAVQAGFFFNNPSAWYLNFGTKQQPTSAKVLTLATMQTYLMLSVRGIEAGAKAEFELDKRYGPVRVRAYAYVEVGGFVSFERPQIGAYFAIGGEALVDVYIASLYIGLDLLLGAEAPKPFLIYGAFRLCVKIKICWFITIKFCGDVELKWEKSREVDRTPIAPVLPEQTEAFVKALHMLNGEVFDLLQLTPSITNASYTPSGNDARFDNAVIPMDTYIDIKLGKGLLPGAVSSKIGSVTNPPENYADLIPPQKVIRGKEVCQVTHHYSIEEINLKAWNGSSWQDYHPYNALQTSSDLSHLKIGHFQKSGKEYNAIRLLATDPFSYTNQGEPGWFIPEQLGVTPASLFCEGALRTLKCSDWITKSLGTSYGVDATFFSHRVAYQITGEPYFDEDNVLHGDRAEIVNEGNVFGALKSLKFDNTNQLSILLPEASTKVSLKLTSVSSVIINYYRAVINDDAIEQEYELIISISKTPQQLESLVDYDNPASPVSKIVIQPNFSNRAQINLIREQIAALFAQTYENAIANGQSTANVSQPDNSKLYRVLVERLKKLKSVGYAEVVDRPKIHGQIYSDVKDDVGDRYSFRIYNHDCGILLSSSTQYQAFKAAELEMKIAVFEVRHHYPNSVQYKQTTTGKWYFNVVDPTGKIIARRIQYFATFALCEAAVQELRTILEENDLTVSSAPCLPGNELPTGSGRSKYFVNRYTESDILTARQYGTDFYLGSNRLTGNSRRLEPTGNLIRLDTHGDPLYSKRYERPVKTNQVHFRSEKMIKLDDGTIVTAGVLNNWLSVCRFKVEGQLLWTRQFPVYGSLDDEYQLIKSEFESIILAFINKDETRVRALATTATDAASSDKYLDILRMNYDGMITASQRLNTYTETRTVHLLAMISDQRAGVILTMHNYNNAEKLICAFNSSLKVAWVTQYESAYSLYDLCLEGGNTLYVLGQHADAAQYCLMKLDLQSLAIELSYSVNALHWRIAQVSEPYFAKDHVQSKLGETMVVYDSHNAYLFDTPKEFINTRMQAVKRFIVEEKEVEITDAAFDVATNSYTLVLDKNMVAHLDNTLDSCITMEESTGKETTKKITLSRYKLNSGTFQQKLPFKVAEYHMVEDELNVGVICTWEVPPSTHEVCHTLLHKVCWLSLEDHIYNANIPGQDATQEDFEAGVEAITQQIAPVWRPNTNYYLHLKLKDNVDNGNGEGIYDYHFGFKTAGPVGHFHFDPGSSYGDLVDGSTIIEDSVAHPDRYLLTSLRGYIDYNRSYPNADGNLLNAKPLFYGDSEMRLFFTQPFTYHLLSGWPAYNGMPALEGEMKIVLKDPSEDVTIENPPPPDVMTTDIPQTVETWKDDNDPRIPHHLQVWNSFVQEQLSNPNLGCLAVGGNPIIPASVFRNVSLNYLKPLKLYTAIVNNTFDGTTRQVHSFVFQTSRYFNFEEQINSYQLSDKSGNSRDAVFEIVMHLSSIEVDAVYDLIEGNSNTLANSLETQYLHPFDRATEGILGINPIDPPLTTEFNIIRNVDSANNIDEIVAILIRNPEPFNNPKIPLSDIGATIAVRNGIALDNNYKRLFSKDYSQVLIMHNSKMITAGNLDFRFQYLKWNGSNYDVSHTIDVDHISL